jgi:tetratricopeptide (TPR) repeat protein
MIFGLFALFFLLSLWFALVVHEAGHLLCAYAMKIPVRLFVVGQGPVLLRFRWRSVPFEFRLFPTKGAVMYYAPLINRKFPLMIFAAGGVASNIALILLFTKSGIESDLVRAMPDTEGAIFLGLALPLMALIPQKVKLYGQRVSSDGLHFIELLKSRNGTESPAGEFLLGRLKKYSSGANSSDLESSTALEVLSLLYRLTNDTQKNDLENCEAELGKLISAGTLPPLEEVLVLDFLIGYAVVDGGDELLPKAQGWLSRALTIVPDTASLNLTHGTILAATGQYRQAKDILLQFSGGANDRDERLMAYFFLAYLEHRLGNKSEAMRWLLEARRIMDTVTASGFFKQRFLALEAEIVAHERLPEIP